MALLNSVQQEILEWALYYSEHNLSIIPVGKNKIPLIPWKDYQYKKADAETIKQWWQTFPDAQIGAVTGKISGITVVDVEDKGDWSFLPQNTTISQTGSGGRHYFYKYFPNLSNKVRIMPLIDFRNDGGYVVLAPSVSEKGPYSWISRVPFDSFPYNLFKESLTEKTVDTSNITSLKLTSDAFITVMDKFSGSGKGSRNSELTSLAGLLLTRTHPFKWDDEVLPALIQANQKNDPPLPEREVINIYKSIVNADISNPTSRWILKEKTITEEPIETEENTLEVLPMREVAEKEKINVDKFFPTGIKMFDDVICGGFLPGDLVVIGASSGNGKTSMSQFLARNFLLSGQKVLFLSYEVLIQHVWDKFKGMGIDDNAFIYAPLKIKGDLTWLEKIVTKAKNNFGTEIVIIDHLGYLTPKTKNSSLSRMSENYSVYITNIVRDVKRLAIDQEISIVMPVHMRKQPNNVRKNTPPTINDIAHSGGIFQEADLVFIMNREEEVRSDHADLFTGYTLVQLAKNRRGKDNPKGYFTLLGDIFVQDEMYQGIDYAVKQSKKRESVTRYDRTLSPDFTHTTSEKDLEEELNNLNKIL